jgi:antitoxin CptB
MDRETRLKRLHYRSSHRGNKEMDIVFTRFAEHGLEGLSAAELDDYEALLDEADSDLWDWVTGKPAPARYHALIARLQVSGG